MARRTGLTVALSDEERAFCDSNAIGGSAGAFVRTLVQGAMSGETLPAAISTETHPYVVGGGGLVVLARTMEEGDLEAERVVAAQREEVGLRAARRATKAVSSFDPDADGGAQ